MSVKRILVQDPDTKETAVRVEIGANDNSVEARDALKHLLRALSPGERIARMTDWYIETAKRYDASEYPELPQIAALLEQHSSNLHGSVITELAAYKERFERRRALKSTNSALDKGRKTATEKRKQEAEKRYKQWREIGGDMFKRSPGWEYEDAAKYIQGLSVGKKNNGESYSLRRIIDKIQGVKSEVLK